MSDSKDQDNDRRAEIGSTLEEIKRLRGQAEEHARAIDQARKKADEDASYANTAKLATEEHSKQTAAFKGTAEGDMGSVSQTKQNFLDLLGKITVDKAAVEADVKLISEHRKLSEQAAADTAETLRKANERFKEIETLRTTIDSTQKSAAEALTLTTQAKSTAEGAQAQTQQFSVTANEATTAITDIKKAVTQSKAEIIELLAQAKTAESNLAGTIERLVKSDEIARSHEARVEKLTNDANELKARVEGLLPGATSAGLASSFNAQKTRFSRPQLWWIGTFAGCILLLFLVALPSFYSAVWGDPTKHTWEMILRGLVMRLPIVIPLIWLAIYAGRNYMLSIRLEEDYAYKEAISRAFEGYKREMGGIPLGDGANKTPLNTLCENVLKALSERPGRIYDGKVQDVTPLAEILAIARDTSDEIRNKPAAG
jgi:hypothetical protein